MTLTYKTVSIDTPKAMLQNPVLLVLNIDKNEKNGWTIKKNIETNEDIPVLLIPTKENAISSSDINQALATHINQILQTKEKISHEATDVLSHGLLEINLDNYQVYWNKQIIELTYTEFSILKGMLRKPERVYSRDNIMDFSYDINVYINHRTIDSHIRYIRKKFAAMGCNNIIKTVHGIGYKMGDCL